MVYCFTHIRSLNSLKWTIKNSKIYLIFELIRLLYLFLSFLKSLLVKEYLTLYFFPYPLKDKTSLWLGIDMLAPFLLTDRAAALDAISRDSSKECPL